MVTYVVAALGGLGFIVLVILLKSIYLVKQAEAIVIERLGKFDRVLLPGLHFVVPFLETPRVVLWGYVKEVADSKYYRFTRAVERLDLREVVDDFPKQNVITRDNVTMEINAILYYHIVDPKAAVYEIINLPDAIEKLTQTTLRNVIGAMDLDQTLVSRDEINEKLQTILDEATDKWGVKVDRVELQEVKPPLDIRQAMEKQMRAERDRRAVILEAEGKKRAAILDAEGEKEAKVLRATGAAEAKVVEAEGEATARLTVAEAESKAVSVIKSVLPSGDPSSYMLAMQYIKVLPEMTKGKDNKLVVVPYEAASLAGAVAGIKKVFSEVDKQK